MEDNQLFDKNNLFEDENDYIEDRLKQKYVYIEEYGKPETRRKLGKPKINRTALKIDMKYKKSKRFIYYKKPTKINNKFLRLLIFSDFIRDEKIKGEDKLEKLYETIMVFPSFFLLAINDLIINNLELKNRLAMKEINFPAGKKDYTSSYLRAYLKLTKEHNELIDATTELLNHTKNLEVVVEKKQFTVLEYEKTINKIKTRLKKLELKYNDLYSDICEEIEDRLNESFGIPDGKIIIQVMTEHIEAGDNEYLMQLYKKNNGSLSETYHNNFRNIFYSYKGRRKNKGKKRSSTK